MSPLQKNSAAVPTFRNCDRPTAARAAYGFSYPRASSSIVGAMSSQPAAQSRMNGLRRCAYCRSSNAQTIAAPNAALRRGLIGMACGARTPTCAANASNIQLLCLVGPFHDEAEARRRVFAHQFVDHTVGHDLIGDVDAQQPPRPRIERRFPQHLRHHLSEAFESRDLRRRSIAVLGA